jgi:hypothetical protein
MDNWNGMNPDQLAVYPAAQPGQGPYRTGAPILPPPPKTPEAKADPELHSRVQEMHRELHGQIMQLQSQLERQHVINATMSAGTMCALAITLIWLAIVRH